MFKRLCYKWELGDFILVGAICELEGTAFQRRVKDIAMLINSVRSMPISG